MRNVLSENTQSRMLGHAVQGSRVRDAPDRRCERSAVWLVRVPTNDPLHDLVGTGHASDGSPDAAHGAADHESKGN